MDKSPKGRAAVIDRWASIYLDTFTFSSGYAVRFLCPSPQSLISRLTVFTTNLRSWSCRADDKLPMTDNEWAGDVTR